MVVQITIDATKALARFSPAGIPEQVRNNLRRTIPGLMKDLTAQIDRNLTALKSRTHLQIKGGPQGVMVENATQIVGRAEMGWTGDEKAKMVPQVLESGSRAHPVTGNPLSFLWPNAPSAVAKLFPETFPRVFYRSVNIPAYPGIHYMENAFNSMRAEIFTKITQAVKEGANQ